MGRKLPERFLKADQDAPCEECEKVRSTCRFCGKCYEHCDCPVCDHCGGAKIEACDDFVREVGSQCNCELCSGWPGKGCLGIIDRDEGHYVPNPNGGCDLMYCDHCADRLGLGEDS